MAIGFVDFLTLWTMATAAATTHNGLCYHPCCDVWTTKSAKLKRASHKAKIQWRQIINSLGRPCENKKQAFLAKMTEEGWRVPALFNKPCDFSFPKRLQHGNTSKLAQPEMLQQELLPPIDPIYLPDIASPIDPHQDPCNIYSKQAP